jgi:hypothetical protein
MANGSPIQTCEQIRGRAPADIHQRLSEFVAFGDGLIVKTSSSVFLVGRCLELSRLAMEELGRLLSPPWLRAR